MHSILEDNDSWLILPILYDPLILFHLCVKKDEVKSMIVSPRCGFSDKILFLIAKTYNEVGGRNGIRY